MIIEKFVEHLPEEPAFREFLLRDRNPLGRTEKMRLISDPNQGMRTVHARLIRYLRGLKIPLPYATGARPRSSPLLNVRKHERNRFFFLLDIANAFPSVSASQLIAILMESDPRLRAEEDALRAFLAEHCFAPEGGLRVGAPASPDLFNLYAGVLLDRPIGALARFWGCTYTRYLDDLTLSSRKLITARKRREVRTVIESVGFRVNHRKAQVLDLWKGPIVVNGIGLRQNGQTFLPRHYLRKLRGLVCRALVRGDVNPHLVHGMMGVFRSASPRWHSRNRTEQKLWDLYLQFHERERARRELLHMAKNV